MKSKSKPKPKLKLKKYWGGGITTDAATQEELDRQDARNGRYTKLAQGASQGYTYDANGLPVSNQMSSYDKSNLAASGVQVAGNIAQYSERDNKYSDANKDMYAQEDQVWNSVGQFGPVGKVIAGAVKVGNAIGRPQREKAESMDSNFQFNNPNQTRAQIVGGGLLNPLAAFMTRKQTGDWTSIDPAKKYMPELQRRKMVETQNKGFEDFQNTQAGLQNYSEFEMGGVKGFPNEEYKPQNGGGGFYVNGKLMHYRMGGKPCFNCGGKYEAGGEANAELEKQEVFMTPNGDVNGVNGPSHEMGGVDVNIPNQTQILSDKLRHPTLKKTFAKLGGKYKTNKEDKVFENPNATSHQLNTAKLVADLKRKKIDELFNTQEELKRSKVMNYAKNMGVDLNEEQGENSFGNEQEEMRMGGELNYSDYNTSHINSEFDNPEYKSGGKHWIQKAINPKHKGYCTPMTKPTCTGRRRALALTFKKHHGFHKKEMGGTQDIPQYWNGGWGKDRRKTGDEGQSFESMVDYDTNNPNDSNDKSFDYSQIGDAVNTVAQMSPYITDLIGTRMGRKYDNENYGQLTPRLPRYDQTMRDIDMQSKAAERDIRSASGGASGQYMANRLALAGSTNQSKMRARREGENAISGVYNQFLPINKQLEMQGRADTQANKARSEDIARMAGRGLSGVAAGSYKDYKAGQMDKNSASLLNSAFANYGLDINNPKHWEVYFKTVKR